MFGYVITLLMLVQSANPIAAKDDIKASLDRAEDLYYEAKFNDSIQLLMRVNDELQSRPDRLSDKVNTKLQLALANIGLNDTEKAKSYFIEMYTLDPNATLDPQKFSPRVITLAGDAKTAMTRIRCQSIGDDARNSLKSGNAAAVRKLLSSPDSKCVDMVAMGPEAADLLYRTGMDSYKNSDYPNALLNFQAALKFSPKHDLAAQYVDLSQGRLQVAEERALIQWQKNWDAHNMKDAAAQFRLISSYNDNKSSQAVRQVSDQYRKALTSLVDSWNKTCPTGDMDAMNDIRSQITELLPDPNFGEDIRATMKPCNPPALRADLPSNRQVNVGPGAAAAETRQADVKTAMVSPTNQCLQIDYRVAMQRLKNRVEPEIPREARPYIQSSSVTVRVKIRVDALGNVISSETPGGNPIFNTAVKTAVDRWKFSPAMDASGARCVDTEIPMVIGPLTSR
jgi:tetratricopeptide (TPR) repeat protein